MSTFWNAKTRGLTPYVPGEQPKDKRYIKLNTNENPYPPSPKVIDAIARAANADLRLYPDPMCESLRETIARRHGLTTAQVFVGNGSDEVLAFAFSAFFEPAETVLFPDVTYSFYPVYAALFGLAFREIPLDEAFAVPVEQFLVANGGIVIANPNAPTGRFLAVDDIKRMVDHNHRHTGRVVIVDEAYIDFGGESALRLVAEYPNVLIVRTLSKSHSLAGLRVGFALGSPELIEGLYRVRNSFNSYTLDRPAIAGAIAAFEDDAYFQNTRARIIATRERVCRELRALGLTVIESRANFVFIRHPKVPAAALFTALRDNGILVRYFNKPRVDAFLRVSIGTDEEMDAFVAAVKQQGYLRVSATFP